MLYTVNTDKEGYIMSLSHTPKDSVELDLKGMELQYLSAYKILDGIAVLDEERKSQIIAEEEAEADAEHRLELKRYLKDTDYVVAETFEKVMSLNNAVTFIADFIKILVEFRSKYADILQARQEAREELNDNTETK